MIQANPAPPKWVKVVLRSVGTANAAAILLGTSFLADSVYRFLTGHIAGLADASAPYFRFAFAVMALIELAFLILLFVTAIRFIQARLSAVNLYSLTVSLLVVYVVTTGMLWRTGQGIGMSIGAATGVTGMATAPFEFLFWPLFPMPFPLYPVVSVVLVQLLKQCHGRGFRPAHDTGRIGFFRSS